MRPCTRQTWVDKSSDELGVNRAKAFHQYLLRPTLLFKIYAKSTFSGSIIFTNVGRSRYLRELGAVVRAPGEQSEHCAC